ncbi:MAG: DegV family protein [Christensenellales bacterium]|jgi:DegV family protein with EDD domain
MSFVIVTDSSANLTDALIDQYDIRVLSLRFYVSGREYDSYIKGKSPDYQQFYTMMRNKENITTTLINPDLCSQVFREILDAGDDLLYIGFSSALSGTYQAGHMVLEQIKKDYPDRKIYDVDTLGASLGEGLLVYHAALLREQGQSIDQVYQWLMDNRLHLCHWFTVDDLFFLKRGGRVSATTAVVGTLLKVKPVMHMDNAGRLIPVDKVMGRRKSLDALVERMERTAIDPANQQVFISHGDCLQDAQYVADRIKQRMGVKKDILIHYVEPVIGAHSGPGTVALFFLGTQR